MTAKTIFTFGAIITVIALAARSAARAFSVQVLAFGKPSPSGSTLTIPLELSFNNPTPLPISIDQVDAEIYLKKANTWVKAGRIRQPLTISGGESRQTIGAKLDVKNIFGGNLVDTSIAVLDALRGEGITAKAEVIITYQGITWPKQSLSPQVIKL